MRWTAAFLAVLAMAAPARAQLVETTIEPAANPNWSTTSGRTVGLGNGAIQLEAGWPGVAFTYLRGVSERTDWGFHVGLNYGLEGTDQTALGLNVGIPYRHTLFVLGDTSYAFEARPGFSIYRNDGENLVGIGGPIGLVAGFKLDPHLTLELGAEVPVLISFANPAGVLFGPQFGAGGEYLLNRNLAVTVRFRIGPSFALDSAGSGTTLGLSTLIGLSYNLR